MPSTIVSESPSCLDVSQHSISSRYALGFYVHFKMELEGRMVSLDRNAAALCHRVEYLIAQQVGHPQKRILIALAGVPGSGKSTLCRAVVDALSTRGIIDVAIVPMVCRIKSWSQISRSRLPRMDSTTVKLFCQRLKILCLHSRNVVLRSRSTLPPLWSS